MSQLIELQRQSANVDVIVSETDFALEHVFGVDPDVRPHEALAIIKQANARKLFPKIGALLGCESVGPETERRIVVRYEARCHQVQGAAR